jgi:hypothetical protein
MKAGPGVNLPAAASGQRYLLINNPIGNIANAPGNNPSAWRNADSSVTLANPNDIIQYDGSRWNVVFDSANTYSEEYVTNLFSNVQYKWLDGMWQKSWEGLYKEGYWLLII